MNTTSLRYTHPIRSLPQTVVLLGFALCARRFACLKVSGLCREYPAEVPTHMKRRRNPAVLAGLAGTAALAAPLPAFAVSMQGIADTVFYNPGTSFVAGAVAGAVVAGSVAGVSCGLALRGEHRRLDDLQNQIDSLAHARGDAWEAPSQDGGLLDEQGASNASSGASDDLERVAESYVAKKSPGRFAAAAQTLRDKMNASRMEGLPVIERVDGSVADVGTGWWTTSVGQKQITQIDNYVAADDENRLAIPSEFKVSGKEQLVEAAKSMDLSAVAAQAARAAGSSVGTARPSGDPDRTPVYSHVAGATQDISKRVAFVDDGIFPEKHDVDDLVSDDDWAAALKSMDERLNAHVAVPEPIVPLGFNDIVGGADTLDEPDGMESPTEFIPFRAHTNHPEVVDTASYVDYLLDDEIGRNRSASVRTSSARYLRLLEGGTAQSKPLDAAGTSSLGRKKKRPNAYVGKHFAVELAKEA